MSASSSAVSGVFSLGFSTMRLLVAMAGATLCATRLSGWLKVRDRRNGAQQRVALACRSGASCRGAISQEKISPSS